MLRDITLGQYFPGTSVLHRSDPRMKLILSVVCITFIFLAGNIYAFAAVLLSALVFIALSGIPASVIIKGIKPLIFVISFTAIINIFWTSGDHLIFEWRFIKVYREGIIYAVFMIIRITSLVTLTSLLLTYTTSPIALTDAIEQLFKPLSRLRIPVHEFAMMMTIALRFIPTLIDETDKIINAQKARGADFDSGGLIKRAKALIPVLVPLIISAFRRAEELATAMECRCYRGGEGRTKMKVLRYSRYDLYIALLGVALLAVIILTNMIPTGFRL